MTGTVRTSYAGKQISVLGDSISTLEGYSEPPYAVFYDRETGEETGVRTPADTWWGEVIASLGASLLVNNAVSGSTVARPPFCEMPSYACSDARTAALGTAERDPDAILILMGINDWDYRVPVDGADGDLSNFPAAYRRMLTRLSTQYPQAELLCLTLPLSTETARYRAELDIYNAAIRDSARRCGCRVLSLDGAAGYESLDGLHPTAVGMHRLAGEILRQIAP